jgi:PAS domain S-box-containing protein
MTEQNAIEILESISDAVLVVDREWHYTYVNTAAERLSGRRREELLGRTRLEMFPGFIGTPFDTACRRAMEERVTVRFDEYNAPFDKWVAETACPSPGGLVLLAQDITDRKRAEEALRKSEERFRRYFELGLVGMAVTSPAKGILEVNDEICRILGYERGELLQISWEKLTHPDDLAADIRNFNQVMDGEIDGYSMDKRFIRKDGRAIHATISVACLRSQRVGARPDGPVDCFVSLLQDITGRKHAEEALERAHAELEWRVAERTEQLTAANRELEKEIAERKQAEAQRDRFFISSPDMLCVAGMDGYFKRLNPAFTQMLGYTTDELMSRPVLDFVHPADRAATGAEQKNLSLGASMMQFENRYECKNGSSRWLSWQAQPVVEEGLVYATARDITEQKAAEYELRRSRVVFENLFKALPGLYLVLTPGLKIVTASDAYLKATMTTLEDIAGLGLFEAFPDNPDDPAATSTANLQGSMDRVLQTGAVDTMAIMKFDIRLPDGSYEERYWSPINAPVFGLDHRIEYIINHVEDVTEFMRQKPQPQGNTTGMRARLEQMEAQIFQNSQKLQSANRELYHANTQLLQAKAEADKANRAKSTFLSTMSHEIRTPMNAILGYAQLMLRDPGLGADAKANLKIIGRSGEHLLGLINEVLDMSKIEAGRMELNPTTFSLSGLLDDLATMFRLRAEAKRLRFEMLVDGESVRYVVADESKLRQALINLLGNAIKFTARGRIKLHVTLTQVPLEHVTQERVTQEQVTLEQVTPDRVTLDRVTPDRVTPDRVTPDRVTLDPGSGNRLWLSARFEDTGSGISDEEQGKLFEPFSQIRRDLHSQEGTGLGLAISRKYARLMGGDITVTSSPGTGSIFRLEIPIERGDAGLAVTRSDSRRVTGIRAGTEAPRILVVEDHLENRDWLMRLLTSIGFCVRGADNGEAAIRKWEQWNPHLILMDVQMPVMGGLEATRRIKADPRGKQTVVIALTASVTDDDRLAVSLSGADGFLAKPCREDELLEKMRTPLNIAYDYQETSEPEGQPGAGAALSAERLGQLPRELAEELRDATLSGNKRLLDKLILKAPETSAHALQELADRYEYDALTRLLEEACRR